MSRKEFLNDLISTYFTLVTLITALMFGMGMCIYPEEPIGYKAYAAPLIYAACGLLPNLLMYSKRELSTKELCVRKVLQLVLVEVLVLAVAFCESDEQVRKSPLVFHVGVGIFVVFVLCHVVSWIQGCLSAKKLTKALVLLQQTVEKEGLAEK